MIKPEIVQFFHNQPFTIISTIDKKGYPHNSCKGIVEIDRSGIVYLLDLYTAVTYENLKNNSRISITAVNEHKFIGYSLKGKAKMVPKNKISKRVLKLWGKKIINRISRRLLKNMHGEKGHALHPEAIMPGPAYLIAVDVDETIDLTPGHIKRKAKN